jgi:hypothetical protein
MRIAQRQTLTLGSYRRLGAGAPLPNGTVTVAARGSVWFDGVDDHYTVDDAASLNYPDADWTVFALIKYTKTSGTQHIWNHGNTGAVQMVELYLNNGIVSGRVRTAGSASTIVTGATLAASNAGGWFLIGMRRTGTDYQVFSCPQDGSVTNGTAAAITTPGAITPSGSAFIASRFDALSSRFFTGHISYVAKVDGAVSDAQVNALAASGDPSVLSPSMYIRLDAASATINDSGSGGNVATRQGAPISRGGPKWTGMPFTIGTLNGKLDAVYGYVFQRASGGTARSIIFNGTYTGAPAGIEARVVNADGTANTPWTRCNTPSAGVWNVTLTVAQGGQLTLEVRDTVTTTNIQRTQLPWGVGEVILVTGESIAQQQGDGSAWTDTASTDYPANTFTPDRQNSSILYFANDPWANSTSFSLNSIRVDTVDNTIWRCATAHTSPASGTFADDRLANPGRWAVADVSNTQVNTLNLTAGSIMHTVDRIRKYTGLPCMGIVCGKSGSKLASGSADWGAPYTSVITHGKLRTAIALTEQDYAGIYWLQGANDANDGTPPSAATYQAALEALIPQIRTYITGRTAATLPVVIAKLGTNTAGTSAVDAGWRQVRNGQAQALPNITNALELEMYDLAHGDALHPSAAGYIRLGKRQAQALLNYLLPGTYTNPMTGATVASASISGLNDIDVVFTLNHGSTLQGLTGSTGLTGFRVFDDLLSLVTITGAIVQSANTIRLTISGVPMVGYAVDYIDIQNPVITNNVFTNASVIGDAAGVPVRAFTAGITV